MHLWSGIGLGLYIFFISVTGSILVYRNEMYMAVTPQADIPGGDAIPFGIRAVSGLIELHDNFLVGDAGKAINGTGAVAVLLVALTGLIIWWPGIRRWRRSLSLHPGVGAKRFIWDLHSAVGFWAFAFIVMFALSGVYLCFPESFHAAANRIDPYDESNAGNRLVDDVLYWLAFLHFGRINGIGIPCDGPGFCDQAVKATWAILGLTPAAMFVTGSIMWWNRVVRRWRRKVATRR